MGKRCATSVKYQRHKVSKPQRMRTRKRDTYSSIAFEVTMIRNYNDKFKTLFENEKKNENCTILIPKGNSYCRRKSSARGPRLKVSSEGLSAEIDIPQRSPIQVQTKADVA